MPGICICYGIDNKIKRVAPIGSRTFQAVKESSEQIGKSMRVPYPDWLIAGRGQAVVVDDSDRGQIGDFNIVPYESISRIELLEPLG